MVNLLFPRTRRLRFRTSNFYTDDVMWRIVSRPSRVTQQACRWWSAAASIVLLSLLAAADHHSPAPPVGASPSVPAFRQANQVGIIPIHGVVDRITLHSLERRIRRAVSDGASAIVLELDTPGGHQDATLDICNLLKDRSVTPANTVAWIRPQAYSAGTIIALACREIIVAPGAAFGDAAPIRVVPGIGLVGVDPAERAKIESPILSEVIDSARRHHYDENLVQAFVSVGVELWLLEHRQSGDLVCVDRDEYLAMFGEDPADGLTSVTPSGEAAAPSGPRMQRRFSTSPSRQRVTDAADRAAGLTEEEIRRQIEFAQQLPASRPRLDASAAADWRPVQQITSSDRLLTVRATEAIDWGLAIDIVASEADLLAFFGAQQIRRYEPSWSEGLVRFLTSLPVRIILIVTFLVAFFLEMAAPGASIFGLVAASALAIFFGAPLIVGMAEWWHVVLVLVGVILLLLEILVIPGTGIAGILGAACLFVGVVGTFITGDVRSAAGQNELLTGILATFTAVFLASVLLWLLGRNVYSIPRLNRLVLRSEIGAHHSRPPESAGSAGSGMLEALHVGEAGTNRIRVGDIGVTQTPLRPAGRARFGTLLVDVHAPGRFIDQGRTVRVTSTEGMVLEVEPEEDEHKA